MPRLQRQTDLDFNTLRERARSPASAVPRPFLRWAGSKQKLLSQIVDLLPTSHRVYFEPFLGSGAMFFLIAPRFAVLNDACLDLISTYQAVRENVGLVAKHLSQMVPNPGDFYRIRAKRSYGRFRAAAEFIYLNKCCWNGLYRVNAAGHFNVPYGRPKTPYLFDRESLHACATALARPTISITCADFEEPLRAVRKGDVVFLDPPYVTRHNNNGFVDYNEQIFSWEDQIRLAAIASKLAKIGAHVLVCNANHREIISLYRGFARREILRSSTLASSTRFRGTVSEVVLYRSQ